MGVQVARGCQSIHVKGNALFLGGISPAVHSLHHGFVSARRELKCLGRSLPNLSQVAQGLVLDLIAGGIKDPEGDFF